MQFLKCLITIFIVLSGFFQPARAYGQERKIKPGDVIEIMVYENKELTKAVLVRPDGTVDYPFLDGLPIDGTTLQRFQEILLAQLSRYMLKSPLVSVRFTDSYPIRVNVLGQVAKPGLYFVPTSGTIQGAIAAAGGAILGAQLSQVKLIRRDENSTNGHAEENSTIDLENFYRKGDPSYLPALKEGDTIVVPGYPTANSIKVLGGVVRPGSYEVPFRTNILDVIFLAGGPTEEANLNGVKIASLGGDKSQQVRINIKEILESKGTENLPYLNPGDVVYVPKRAVTWKKFVSFLRDFSTFATLYVVIRNGR